MADTTRRGGVIKVTIAGVAYEVEGDISVQPYTFMRESVGGLTGPRGHKRTHLQPKISITLFKRSDQPLSFLRDLVGSRVVVRSYEGTDWLAVEATRVGEMPLDLAEGTFTIEIDSPHEIKEIPATS